MADQAERNGRVDLETSGAYRLTADSTVAVRPVSYSLGRCVDLGKPVMKRFVMPELDVAKLARGRRVALLLTHQLVTGTPTGDENVYQPPPLISQRLFRFLPKRPREFEIPRGH